MTKPDKVEVIVVSGDRDYNDVKRVNAWLDTIVNPMTTVIIAGGANGLDTLVEEEAKKRGIHVAVVDALWGFWGKITGRRRGNPAGPKRNTAMLWLAPDRLVAFHKDISSSKGTADMLAQAEGWQIPFELIED